MKVIELDLTGCKYLSELHERIRAAFDFPEWYGQNWSAFWDFLWSECDAGRVIIKGENTLSADFDAQISKMHEILERNKQVRSNSDSQFDYEIIR